MSALTNTITALITARHHEITRDNGTKETVPEEPYLDTLEHIITNGQRGTGGAGKDGGSTPIALAALDLREGIARVVDQHWPGRGRTHLARTPLRDKIEAWRKVSTENGPLHEYATDWCQKIRSMTLISADIEAPCPMCDVAEILEQDDTEMTNVFHKTALTYNTDRAVCRNCGSEWWGFDEMKELAGQMARSL